MEINEHLKQWATSRQAEMIDAVIKHGGQRAAAVALGVSRGTLRTSIERVIAKATAYDETDDAIKAAAEAGGIKDVRTLSHFWQLVKDENGNGYSLFVKNPNSGTTISVTDLVRDAISPENGLPAIKLPPRPKTTGEHLLVIDLADVHFLKLCVKTETGYEYNREVAAHRVVEGTKALLRSAAPHGIGRVLFVLGNDILHVDGPRATTTSGTYQDTEGTIYQGFKDAAAALELAITEASKVADVDLIHCMSNHDWLMGWALSQTVAARLRGRNPRVHATDYNLSEAHRKYYRFERNLIGLSHGDGAKEEKLYGVMVKEAREHVSDCQNLYWYLHHVHHKVRNVRGEDKPYLREKDHNGMTVHVSGEPRIEGDHINIEYVRSPSPPDSWHDRQGYVNRQAVECFIHHPTIGQRGRFTEWF